MSAQYPLKVPAAQEEYMMTYGSGDGEGDGEKDGEAEGDEDVEGEAVLLGHNACSRVKQQNPASVAISKPPSMSPKPRVSGGGEKARRKKCEKGGGKANFSTHSENVECQ